MSELSNLTRRLYVSLPYVALRVVQVVWIVFMAFVVVWAIRLCMVLLYVALRQFGIASR